MMPMISAYYFAFAAKVGLLHINNIISKFMCLKSTRLKLIKTRLTNPDLFSSRFTFGRNS